MSRTFTLKVEPHVFVERIFKIVKSKIKAFVAKIDVKKFTKNNFKLTNTKNVCFSFYTRHI